MAKKLNIGILGSGNIGTDLLVKVLRSDFLDCAFFVGRNLNSVGMKKASNLGVRISDLSIDAFVKKPQSCDLVFDCTSAAYHVKHAPIFASLGIKVIDMTPSQVGDLCVPAINMAECMQSHNLNMITCGGQASIPVAHLLKDIIPTIECVEVVSAISSRSAGPGTRANLDEYIENTEKGLTKFTGCAKVKTILNLNPADPCINMQTSIFAKVKECDASVLHQPIQQLEDSIKKYVPGYEIVVPPIFENGRIMTMVRVSGLGDYLPRYAGNLDIINCAAIAMAEEFAHQGM